MRHASSANETRNFNIHPFSSASLANILTEFSELSIVRVAIGYTLMVIFPRATASASADWSIGD